MKARVRKVGSAGTPLEAFEPLAQEPYSFLLDSGTGYGKLGRYSLLGSKPFLVFRSKGDLIELETVEGVETLRRNPFDVLESLLLRYRVEQHPRFPFAGGAVGYLGYDMYSTLYPAISSMSVDDVGGWDCCLGFYDSTVVFDNLSTKTYEVSVGLDAPRIERLKKRTRARGRRTAPSSNFTKSEYKKAIEKVKGYIRRGDIYQVNLSQRFSTGLSSEPWHLYKKLRTINPAPFAAYLNFDDTVIVSTSPERFLKVNGRQVETRPMKGTRPRGKTPTGDESLKGELMDSEKDRAENLMIVDLERNDLGKVCEFGSVRVSRLWDIEEYPTVFQMVSTVEGRLRKGVTQVDCLRACFPGGSITGAPKVRSMEIIEELEPTKRGIYTGSIGYLSFNGNMDLNIVIRTIVIRNGKAYFQVGGGIVADSDPDAEYQETLDKAKALMDSLK